MVIQQSYKKVLIIRLSSIGDILLTTPIIRCIKQQWSASIHFLTLRRFVSLLEYNPYIDSLLLYEKGIIPRLRSEEYDLVIDLHRNAKSFIIKSLIQRPVITYRKHNIEKWLLVRFNMHCIPAGHVIDRYFQALDKTGIQNDGRGLDFFVDPRIEKKSKILLPSGPYYVLVLGGTYFTKRISLNKAMEIISKIDLPVVLLGGSDVKKTGDFISEKFPDKARSLAGIISIHSSAALIKHSRFVVTGDTGLMHLASAFQKKIFVLWGNTVPAFGLGPYITIREKNIVTNIESQLSCRPCSKLGHQECPKRHFLCMESLDISSIVNFAKTIHSLSS
ncbi:MAG TPA: glycosyltransferase family 9 protein [Saprospiraceae bacterium]|nr:glycosyltransferase family 9 protein [Saprospiraceae bacterium]